MSDPTGAPAGEVPPRRRRRRRRGRGERRGGLYLLPHLFTTANLFFGFYAIVQATSGAYDRAALGIVLAAVADILDGRVARFTRTTSRFGAEYDSLADAVSFGVAPALLAFHAGNLGAMGRPGWVLAFVYVVCALLRLARFNIEPGRVPGRFEGLPSPAAAGTVASTQWFVSFVREQGITVSVPEEAVAGATALLGLLMVSEIPYRSFKQVDVRHSFRTFVLVVLGLAVVILNPRVSLFALAMAYLLSGPAEWLWRRTTHRPLTELPEPVPHEPGAGTST